MEVVSDVTSEAFLAALKRFVSRRGNCRYLYCDNATNFVGASRELEELKSLFLSQATQEHIQQLCAEDGTTFSFIPPRSPHFGGLWEPAVKAAKSFLLKTMRASSLTFEELNILTTQIEAVLNSRPITSLSSEPYDLEALTPAHFLVGEPLTTILEPDLTESKLSHLSRWHQLRALHQHFWKRWSKEYLNQLQQRNKWTAPHPNLKVGTLVLVAEDNFPPQKWLLGRVAETFCGHDKRVRVVTIVTRSGLIKRAVHKVAPLPIES